MSVYLDLKIGVLIIAAIANIFLGITVYKNKFRSATNNIYFALSVVISLWLIANFTSVLPAFISISLWLIRLSIFFAVLMSALFYLFASTLPSENITLSKNKIRFTFVSTVITMILTLTPLVFSKVNIVNKSPHPKPGPAIGLFTVVTTVFSILAIYKLFHNYRRSKGLVKRQFAYTLFAISLLLGLIILTVLLPVLVFKINTTVSLIPIYTVIFLGITTYAIVAQKLFDIRLAVARSVGYIFSLAVITLVFVAPTIALTNSFLHENLSKATDVTFTVVAFLVAILYQRIHRSFDKITNRIFFRDYYDVQDILDQLGDLLVVSVDLNDIKEHSKTILTTAIKPGFFEYLLVADINDNRRELLDHLRHSSLNLIVLDELDSSHHAALYNALSRENIAIAVRLRTTKKDLGFMILGYKESGSVYSETDKRLLTIAADEIAIGLQNALRFEEIQQFNITLQEKIDEATHKLRKANDRLKELDETKDDFISMSSHQLRTPLTSIKGYVSLVLDGDAGHITSTQRKLLAQALNGSQRMVDLISDLLNVSRLKTGKFVIEPVPVNIVDTIDEEMGRLKEMALARNLELTLDAPKKFPTLKLDELKTRQVIMNFIDNAIYYTPTGGHIKVELRDNPDNIELRVIDDGIGVPEKEKSHLFTKFYRAPNAQKARPDGTGIGLFLAKQVIEAQHGTLIFESQEGKGSTFGFRFSKKDH